MQASKEDAAVNSLFYIHTQWLPELPIDPCIQLNRAESPDLDTGSLLSKVESIEGTLT